MSGKAGEKADGVLRIDFAEPTEGLERITWYDFFEAFEQNKLAFLYQDEPNSRFVKLVSRDGKTKDPTPYRSCFKGGHYAQR